MIKTKPISFCNKVVDNLMEFKDIENDYRIEWWNLEKNMQN